LSSLSKTMHRCAVLSNLFESVGLVAELFGSASEMLQSKLPDVASSPLKGAPSTAVMTTNITRFMMDVGDVMLGRKPADVAKARDRVMRTWPAIVGFAVGCGLGPTCEATIWPASCRWRQKPKGRSTRAALRSGYEIGCGDTQHPILAIGRTGDSLAHRTAMLTMVRIPPRPPAESAI
jgi:hypothetical protein